MSLALVKTTETLQGMLDNEKTMTRLSEALKGAFGVSYFETAVMKAIYAEPRILECTKGSAYGAIMTAAQFRLIPNTTFGYCYLIPYYNSKVGCYELTFQMGYKGFIELVYRTMKQTIFADVVYPEDVFEYEMGTDPKIRHVPSLTGKRVDQDIIATYAVTAQPDGSKTVMVMPRADIDKVMKFALSKNKKFSPWESWYGEMVKKTAIKRLLKLMPVSDIVAQAHGIDGQSEAGIALYEGDGEEYGQPTKIGRTEQEYNLIEATIANANDEVVVSDTIGQLGSMSRQPAFDQSRIEDLKIKAYAKLKELGGKNV